MYIMSYCYTGHCVTVIGLSANVVKFRIIEIRIEAAVQLYQLLVVY